MMQLQLPLTVTRIEAATKMHDGLLEYLETFLMDQGNRMFEEHLSVRSLRALNILMHDKNNSLPKKLELAAKCLDPSFVLSPQDEPFVTSSLYNTISNFVGHQEFGGIFGYLKPNVANGFFQWPLCVSCITELALNNSALGTKILQYLNNILETRKVFAASYRYNLFSPTPRSTERPLREMIHSNSRNKENLLLFKIHLYACILIALECVENKRK